jgi:hypothetical protein
MRAPRYIIRASPLCRHTADLPWRYVYHSARGWVLEGQQAHSTLHFHDAQFDLGSNP